MSDQPRPTFDPAKLREERHSADLGADEETGHDKLAHDDAQDPPLGSQTSGATPPAR
jgi:hypothetical protein